MNCGFGEETNCGLDSKEIRPVNSKGNIPCIFNGRTDSEAEATIL